MFFPNLVAFTSESETCKMKRCMQGDIEIHDGFFYAFTKRNLNIWTTKSDHSSKIKVANESLAAAIVEAVECLLSKL